MLIVIESLIWTSWHVIFLAHPKGPQKPARELNTTCGGQFTLPSVPRKSWQIWIFIYLYPKEKCELRVFTHPKCTNSCWQHLSQLSNILVAPQPWKNRWQPRTDLPHICWDGKFFKRLSMFSSQSPHWTTMCCTMFDDFNRHSSPCLMVKPYLSPTKTTIFVHVCWWSHQCLTKNRYPAVAVAWSSPWKPLPRASGAP